MRVSPEGSIDGLGPSVGVLVGCVGVAVDGADETVGRTEGGLVNTLTGRFVGIAVVGVRVGV